LLAALSEKLGVTLDADAGARRSRSTGAGRSNRPVNPSSAGTGAFADARAWPTGIAEARRTGRSTRYRVLLPDGVSYRAGDTLSIVPQNAPPCRACLRRFAFAPGAMSCSAARAGRANLPVGEADRRHRLRRSFVELSIRRRAKHIQAMAQHTRCPSRGPSSRRLLDEERFRAEILAKR